MGWEFSTDVLSMIRSYTGVGKFMARLNTTVPKVWCSGYESVTYDGSTFEPKGMKLPSLTISAEDVRSTLILEDIWDETQAAGERSLAEWNFSTQRFSGLQMEWFFGYVEAGVWVPIYELVWTVKTEKWRPGQFRFELLGSSGTYPRAGLTVHGRACDLKYNGELCAASAGGAVHGTYLTCTGTKADCTLRGREISWRGFEYALEAGEAIRTGLVGSPGVNGVVVSPPPYTPPPDPGGPTFTKDVGLQVVPNSPPSYTNGENMQEAISDYVEASTS